MFSYFLDFKTIYATLGLLEIKIESWLVFWTNVQQLLSCLKQETLKGKFVKTWIAQRVICDTCKLFPKHLQLVIDAKGGHTEWYFLHFFPIIFL